MTAYVQSETARKTNYQLGLIGYPLGHSRSPQLHHAALRACGLAGEYSLFPIPPLPEGAHAIADLLVRMRSGELQGLNVTIPHKPSVMPHVDRLTDVARAVGAVNTLYMEGDRLVGDNTDVPGFLRDVEKLTGAQRGRALVLGAGGSARAVVYALARAGWQVQVLARRSEQAAALIAEIGAAPELCAAEMGAEGLAALQEVQAAQRLADGCKLVVNTTPLGMYPHPEDSPWPEKAAFPPDAAVYDLVYNPQETHLVRDARDAGLLAATGAGMLVAQAALAFARWTGLQPPYEIMEQAFTL
jgi:shikimate dehydrogenase